MIVVFLSWHNAERFKAYPAVKGKLTYALLYCLR